MMGAYLADIVVAELNDSGETMTLRRLPSTDVSVKGKRYAPQGMTGVPLAGSASQIRLRVKISNAEIAAAGWPGPPKDGDLLIISGKPYRLDGPADTHLHDGVTLCHFLDVLGGPG